MLLNPESGRYVFEVVLGYQMGDEVELTIPYVIQADAAPLAEEKVLAYLDEHGVAEVFWIEEMSDPYEVLEYQEGMEDNGDEAHILLEDLTDEDFREMLSE
jgi:Uma2 family endonuclease